MSWNELVKLTKSGCGRLRNFDKTHTCNLRSEPV